MRKEATVNNVYEAITMQMLKIATEAAVDPIAPPKADTSYGWAGAHVEGEIYAASIDQMVPYSLNVYWTNKNRGAVSIMLMPDDRLPTSGDFNFTGRRSTSEMVAKQAQDLLYKLRGKVR